MDVEKFPNSSLDDLFGISQRATDVYREFFCQRETRRLGRSHTRRAREWKASRRKMVAQALTHSIRHWAQISTYLRQQGLKQEWKHDLLMSEAMK
jgi:uncharacterized damage-inducible protein DinB